MACNTSASLAPSSSRVVALSFSARCAGIWSRSSASGLVGSGGDDVLNALVAHQRIERVHDFLDVLQVQVLDVALVARLRPAALRMPVGLLAGHLLRVLDRARLKTKIRARLLSSSTAAYRGYMSMRRASG